MWGNGGVGSVTDGKERLVGWLVGKKMGKQVGFSKWLEVCEGEIKMMLFFVN